MGSRIQLGCGLAVALLCAMVRPAFADGVMGYYDNLGWFLIVAMILIGIVIVFVLRVVFWLSRSKSRSIEGRPEVEAPPARVVKE
jgi:uncharacterized membrane protein